MAESKKAIKKEAQYWEGLGRRKTARARVRLYEKGTGFTINDKKLETYFRLPSLVEMAASPLAIAGLTSKFKITVRASGGGVHGQAEAVRHGLARAIVKYNHDFHQLMREQGYLTRDPRMKERKKPGRKGARKSPQWSKR